MYSRLERKTGFKKATRASTKPKTRRKLPKKAKYNLAKRKEKLWELCKLVIRAKYPNVCYTCGKPGLQGSDWHTGHGKPKGALPLRYQFDIRNLRPQCMHDNKNLGGCSDIFIAKMEREPDGLAFLQESCRYYDGQWHIRKEETMGSIEAREFVEKLIADYTALLASLTK
jgi:hypothetical protein